MPVGGREEHRWFGKRSAREGLSNMSDEQAVPNSKGPAPMRLPAATQPNVVPATDVKPEDIGTLSIEYQEGRSVIVASGGTHIPAVLTVVDNEGIAVGAYTAGPVPKLNVTGVITPLHYLYEPQALMTLDERSEGDLG
ncbi:hypothetical protein [Streptomyces sp. SID3343]|uniref:hypothetical protein n=1 Tax=Streptomyces sp. SID3343 TaxID=2690260 RepID=UPI00136E9747|nr:hypothetical protein [Streptomyces sp. SID3343]MYV99838.1 hypothetical protein [Streptomyces sp. SID3343]